MAMKVLITKGKSDSGGKCMTCMRHLQIDDSIKRHNVYCINVKLVPRGTTELRMCKRCAKFYLEALGALPDLLVKKAKKKRR